MKYYDRAVFEIDSNGKGLLLCISHEAKKKDIENVLRERFKDSQKICKIERKLDVCWIIPNNVHYMIVFIEPDGNDLFEF